MSEVCHCKEAMCAIPSFQRGVGRCAQAKQWGCTQGQWPEKNAEFYCTCSEMQSAELKGLDVDSLVTEHILVSKSHKAWVGLTELMVRSAQT